MFLHLMKKKDSVLCRFVHFKGVGVTDSRLQNIAYPLLHFTAFIQFVLVLIYSLSLAILRLTTWICTNRQ